MRYVYLHGFASGPSSGKAQAFRRHFADLGLDLQIPDLNVPNFESMTISSHLEAVERLLNGEPARLIGSSMGGYLAALYASRHAEVDRVVLLAPAFEFFERWPRLLGDEVFAQWEANGWREVLHYGENQTRRIGWGLIADARQYPSCPVFAQPALLFHGLQDDTVPVELSERYAAAHPNVTLRLLPSDHQLTDSVDRICRETEEFFDL